MRFIMQHTRGCVIFIPKIDRGGHRLLSAVFLPLTLIAGWYGMNFSMPEYGWALGYPMVIVLSIAVCTACILFFRRKKWF